MTLRVIGKNIDVGESLRERANERLAGMLGKYFSHGYSGHVSIEKVRQVFRTEFSIHLDSGIYMQAEGEGEDAYRSLEAASERLEKRLRRYKRRLKDHHQAQRAVEDPVIAPSFVLAEVEDDTDAAPADDSNPLVVAEQATEIRTQTVGMAAMAMDLSDAPVSLFRNAANGRLNIVYRRADGNIGWIDPPSMDKA